MRFPTGAFLFRRDGRAWLIASVLKTDTGNTDVGSNPTLSAKDFNRPQQCGVLFRLNGARTLEHGRFESHRLNLFCGSARIDVHPGASQPVMTGNDEAGLSAEMFRDKPHPLPKPSREAAARPKCAGNDMVIPYAGIAVSRPKAAVCRWIGSESAQVSQGTRSAAEHLTQPNRTKPDSSPTKISPKCCLPSSTLPNPPHQSKAHGNTAVSSRSDRPHSPFDKDKPSRRSIPRPSSPSFVAGFCSRRQHARRSDYSQHTAFPCATCQPQHFMVPMPEVRCNGPLTWQ